MPNKRTGLGGSLLLRRTEPPQPTTTEEDSQTPERLDAPRTAAGRKPARPLRDRCTVYLDPEVNKQLDLVARIECKERSEVVTDLLRQHLPKYEINLQ